MAAFVQGRSTFGSSGIDFSLGFDMAARKYPTEDFSCSANYSNFTDDTSAKYTDSMRSLPSTQQHQHHQHQQHPPNHFTFNQSITHVNLINNRFEIDIPTHQHHNSSFPNAHNDYQNGVPDDLNVNMHSPTGGNQYFPVKSDIHSVSRVNSFTETNHMACSYPSAPTLINSASPGHNQIMNIYQQSQHSFPMKISPLEEYSSIGNFNKYSMQDNSLCLPNHFNANLRKPDSEYSPSFYPEHPILSSNNNCLSSTILPSPSSVNKMTHIFPPHPGQKQRDHDVEQVNESQKCKNTIEGTKTSVRRFKRWYKEKYSKDIDMNTVNRFNAPELLKDFFLDIRDTRPGRVGNEYEPVTLTTYRNGLRRYFLYRKVPPAPDNFDLTDKTFDIVNKHLVTKRDDLKRKGKGNHPNAIESITPEQLEKMWASGAIGTHAPRPLLRLQWWYNTVYHGVRGRMAHHDLTTDDFATRRDVDGKLYMEYNKKNQFPNQNTMSDKIEPPKKKKFKGVVKETDGGDRDPLKAFELFKTHRPPGISSFYLTPKHKPKGNTWFNKVPMGKNSIGRIMREIKAISGI